MPCCVRSEAEQAGLLMPRRPLGLGCGVAGVRQRAGVVCAYLAVGAKGAAMQNCVCAPDAWGGHAWVTWAVVTQALLIRLYKAGASLWPVHASMTLLRPTAPVAYLQGRYTAVANSSWGFDLGR